jgi:hypothetical protein
MAADRRNIAASKEKSNWSPAGDVGGVVNLALASGDLQGHHTKLRADDVVALKRRKQMVTRLQRL